MGDIANSNSSELFIKEFGDDLVNRLTPVLNESIVASFLEHHEVFDVVMLVIIIRDRDGNEYRFVNDTILFDPCTYLSNNNLPDELAKLIYGDECEEYIQLVIERLKKSTLYREIPES